MMGELEDPEISIAAMCDILFVLLTFFMSVTSVEIIRTTTEVDLPEARDATKLKERIRWIYIDLLWVPGSGGSCSCEQKKYTEPEMLAPLLARRAAEGGITTACIRADKGTQYFYISRLTKVIAEAGIANVVFGTYAEPVGAPAGGARPAPPGPRPPAK
ncbi:MAG: biopolymer transporter ExbD [Verrucomicrobia bacterium]|nr:biopolymer transporter ExbD [Verrucomicrobiota bacterium]